MVSIASRYFPAVEGKAEKIPLETASVGLVVCRQTFQFLQAQDALAEIGRVLAPGGKLIISLTVPFSAEDYPWLYEIHRIKQPLLRTFYNEKTLTAEIERAGFTCREVRRMEVRESINRWMRFAPELSEDVKRRVIEAVANSPEPYRSMHNVAGRDGEVFEDWHWVVISASRG
jgi:ubiquinone/menaquinone biosynthesis C-methylase UbiE